MTWRLLIAMATATSPTQVLFSLFGTNLNLPGYGRGTTPYAHCQRDLQTVTTYKANQHSPPLSEMVNRKKKRLFSTYDDNHNH